MKKVQRFPVRQSQLVCTSASRRLTEETVLLLGTGARSLQFAKLLGQGDNSSSDEKLARALELGADETINYKASPLKRKSTN